MTTLGMFGLIVIGTLLGVGAYYFVYAFRIWRQNRSDPARSAFASVISDGYAKDDGGITPLSLSAHPKLQMTSSVVFFGLLLCLYYRYGRPVKAGDIIVIVGTATIWWFLVKWDLRRQLGQR